MSKKGQRQRRQRPQQGQAPPPFETTKAEHFRYVYSTGVYGGLNQKDGNLVFYLDRMEPESVPAQPGRMRTAKVNQELQVEVRMSLIEFKSVALFMADRIKHFEEQFGEIQRGPPSETDEDNPLVQ